MRIPYLIFEDTTRHYQETLARLAAFEVRARPQSSWFFHAHDLVTAANLAYALGNPLTESRKWLCESLNAYRNLFSLRGTGYCSQVTYHDGKPGPEEKVFSDGYTSVHSFEAALASLSVQDVAQARSLVELAGHSPGAEYVSPQSEVRTSNQQTLSHALNALLMDDPALAQREAGKLGVRRGTQFEKQVAVTILAIATDGDVLSELDALAFYHAKLAKRRNCWTVASYYLCLPALGLAHLATHYGRIEHADLTRDNVYAPPEFFNVW